jgi:hypothetical protein
VCFSLYDVDVSFLYIAISCYNTDPNAFKKKV